MVQVTNKYNQPWDCRALIDSGSTHTYITSSLVTTLGLKRLELSSPMNVKGLSDTDVANISHTVELEITTTYSPDTIIRATALIVKKASGVHPRMPINPTGWTHLQQLNLADPAFPKSRGVDILFGADIYPRLIRGTIIRGNDNQPIAQESVFGWTVLGPTITTSGNVSVCYNSICPLDSTLRKFWEIEDCPSQSRTYTKEEEDCEEHFRATTTRSSDGVFEVALPFRPNRMPLGNSKSMALRRFYNLETKLSKNATLKQQYFEQIHSLLQDGHLRIVPKDEINVPDDSSYYLPHHAVIKEASSTTKVRIVFDASAATSSGQSLNEQLMVGPVHQQDLFSILVRWRYWKVALTADIRQMYLFINVKKEHQDYLRIFWRDSPSEPIKTYKLAKVTFGTSSAPYLAIKTIQTLAEAHAEEYPLASAVLKRDFYVDDCLSGARTQEEAVQLQQQLMRLTEKGGFLLRKWTSSDADVLDAFTVQSRKSSKVTKRIILSEIARVFDPLGFLAPITVRGKIIMQQLWSSSIGWDSTPSEDRVSEWIAYQTDLMLIKSIRIPRWVNQDDVISTQLHGFSDASTKAYAAAIYIRTISRDGNVVVRLVASKSRVSPIKTTSIPRLELCATELLAHLMEAVVAAFPVKIEEIYAWTDSTVTLYWILQPPSRWETFVANRVPLKIPQLHNPVIPSAVEPPPGAPKGDVYNPSTASSSYPRSPSVSNLPVKSKVPPQAVFQTQSH
ncbi:unnamed protein product [Allacma fusca]|uniref:Peptidase aspartic putative domain-containing protein n=1 Tax=Allacma fusca TaxID=39272 RepID=A0A8J2NPD6_9HEXA|nr:unnamed protein product [Allacma fusca]